MSDSEGYVSSDSALPADGRDPDTDAEADDVQPPPPPLPRVGADAASASASDEPAATAAPAVQFNPISRWEEEPLDLPGLTLWDLSCKPRQIKEDPNTRVRVQVKTLSSEFHCPVCLGYFRKPVTVKDCMHRFCSECIEKCLRLGKKECPSCRIHIPSRRSLRFDNKFEELMTSIYGDIAELEENEAKEIEMLNRTQNMNTEQQKSRKMGILQQNRTRGHKKRALEVGAEQSAATGSVVAASVMASDDGAGESRPKRGRHGAFSSFPSKFHGLQKASIVAYELRRHPQERNVDHLDKAIVRTSDEMQIRIVKIFLSNKLSHAPPSDFQIICSVGGKETVLSDEVTIGQLRDEIIDPGHDALMVLKYRLRR